MRREIGHLCRLSAKKIKQLCPFLAAILLLFYITKVEVGQSYIRDTISETQVGYFIGNQSANHTFVTTYLKGAAKGQGQVNDSETGSSLRRQQTISGEVNAARVKAACKNYNKTLSEFDLTLRLGKENKLLLCPVYKVGTTFWRRVFMIQREKKFQHLVNPYEISFEKDYKADKLKSTNVSNMSAYKVMFTRNPYVRLFSFYVDKLLAPNPVFWKTVGLKVLKFVRGNTAKKECGHDVTFREFIKYAIHTLETNKDVDPHWVVMTKNCHPCEIKYDFIGKMENFAEDSLHVVRKLGLSKMADFLERNGSDVANDDAIHDTLSQPFTFRIKYRPCMSFKDAVARAWTKLQIRGLVGNETLEDLVLDEKKTRIDALLHRVADSRNTSDCSKRKHYKNEMYKEYWSTVESSDIDKLKRLYREDFDIFGYDENSVRFT